MSFDSLGLSAELLRAIREQNYEQPTPIQCKAIPVILDGKDIMAGAQTGTGKTAGFAWPILERLSKTINNSKDRPIRALVLTPTRELAAQVAESIEKYARYLPLESTVIFGGVKINPQIKKLRSGVDILVATPGRLLDHVNQKNIDLSHIETLVLDEADRMLDMGFINDIRKILSLIPGKRQSLMFSATFSFEIRQLANKLLNSPVSIEVAKQNATAEHINQVVHPVDKSRKSELLSFLIGSENWQQVLVFTRTKRGADRLAEQLGKNGVNAASIHGDKKQGARTKALADFKKGKIRVLVATDIAARGLDIQQLPHVVNYELPDTPEDYVHRIGRTGRAGNEGQAMSLVCVDEKRTLLSIERLIKYDIPKIIVPDFEPDPRIIPQPSNRGGGSTVYRGSQSRPSSQKRNSSSQGNKSGKNPSRRQSSQNQKSGAINYAG